MLRPMREILMEDHEIDSRGDCQHCMDFLNDRAIKWCNGHPAYRTHIVGSVELCPSCGKWKVESFQDIVSRWLESCFGKEAVNDKSERNHRFLEESLELVQSLGCTREEAHMLVEYVFDRPTGDPMQEAL